MSYKNVALPAARLEKINLDNNKEHIRSLILKKQQNMEKV